MYIAAGDILKQFSFLFLLENRACHFMLTVSRDNGQELSSPIFKKKKKKKKTEKTIPSILLPWCSIYKLCTLILQWCLIFIFPLKKNGIWNFRWIADKFNKLHQIKHYHSMGKLSRWHIANVVPIIYRKQDLTLHANCLHWHAKPCFFLLFFLFVCFFCLLFFFGKK